MWVKSESPKKEDRAASISLLEGVDSTSTDNFRYVDVSVLVPTRERPELLHACLKSILANDHASFEVIVIDQSDQPYGWLQDPRLRIFHSQARGKSAALNEAIPLAGGRFLAFTDDDCTVPADWLTKGQTLLEARSDVDLTYGALWAIPHEPRECFIPTFEPARLETVSGVSHARLRGGAGANMFARRELFAKIGGFDEAIGPGARFKSCEEYDIYFRCLRFGMRVVRDPANGVLHWGKRPYADGSGQQLVRDYSYGEGAVLAKHVRSGDVAALWTSLGILGEQVAATASNLLRGRMTGVGRAAYWLAGFSQGLVAPVDTKARLFSTKELSDSSAS